MTELSTEPQPKRLRREPQQQQQQRQQPAAAQPPPQQQQHLHQHQQAAAPQPVLPWMRLPISIPSGAGVPLAQVAGLAPALAAAVSSGLGFRELFPVQAAVWRGLAGGHSAAHDMCVCAPTGSGKTLAYALPVLNALASSCRSPGAPRCLEAVVVLPTRGLAVQVHRVLEPLGRAAGVRVALAAAQESVAAEAAALLPLPGQPGSGAQLLVATPGRLMAHLHGSPRLSLAGLRWLVVDEADRLLRQHYQGWLPEVLRATAGSCSSMHQQQTQQQQPASSSLPLLPCGDVAGSSSSSSSRRVAKLVVSATLTRDPSKLLRLQLHQPRFISLADAGSRYVLPPGLAQHRLVVPAQHKPLALVALLHRLAGSSCIVFASSRETTHRLALLLAAVPGLPDRVVEYSGHVAPRDATAALADFSAGRARVLVTSDAMARGMDVAGVGAVVNYDPPTYAKAYVHRAGRTARAGAAGSVFTLLKPEDAVHFNSLAAKLQAGRGRVAQLKLPPAELAPLRPALTQALAQVQALLAAEKAQQAAQQQQAVARRQQQQQQQQDAAARRQASGRA